MRICPTLFPLAFILNVVLPLNDGIAQNAGTQDPSGTQVNGALSTSEPAAPSIGAATENPASSITAATDDAHHPIADNAATATPAPEPAAQPTTEPATPPGAIPAVETPDPAAPQKPLFTIGGEVRDLLPKVKDGAEASDETKAVSAVYAARRDDAIWVTANGLNARGAKAVDAIKAADDWGLEAGDYVLPSLPEASNNAAGLPRDQLADAELKISFAVLAYARDARGGRIMEPAKQLSSYLDRSPQLIEPRILLEELAQSDEPGEFLRKLHPQQLQFEKLRQKYIELRSKAADAREVVRLPGSGPKLIAGMKHPDVALLRQRLGVGISQAGGIAADETVYDVALEEAVKAYQTSQGQKSDGIIGKATRNALNAIDVPDPKRLLANMEQWRWMPAQMGETYINVNIPEFMVRVVQNGKVIFEERVVTGQLDKQTPVFSDQLETVIFHPRWNVPESIKVLELYPSLARGGGSFQRQGLKLMRNGREVSPSSVDWGSADIRNYDVFQPAGEGNVLGLVKFVFPNKHGVYLHDTTAKGLFEEPSRPFSHGCMRVRNPVHFAETLLGIDKAWPATRISEILDSNPDEVPVQIETTIPVHVTYFTDVIDENGEEHIFKDVYGHEQRIKLALAGRFSEIAVGSDHLAPVKFTRAQYASSPDDWGLFFGGGATSNGTGNTNSVSNTSLGDFLTSVFGGSPPPAKQRKRRAAQ